MKCDILIVDDEDVIGQLLKDFFEDFDLVVEVAVDASSGMKFLRENDVKVAIVDMRLPDMYGNEFISQIYPDNSSCKYYIHTGSLEYSIPEDMYQYGMDKESIIYKPVRDMMDIYDKISKHFN